MARRDGRRPDGKRSDGGGPGPRKKAKPPTPETVVFESTFVSPKGRAYRILRTNQSDPYDPPGTAPEGSPGGTGGKPRGGSGG
jgi:hypothetical protein